MNTKPISTSVMLFLLLVLGNRMLAQDLSAKEIMSQLAQEASGKTEVVKKFPSSFPEILTARGLPTIYTKENSENFEYIGMPIGGIGAGQLYLGGDGKFWFWDIFSLNYEYDQLKGEEAYQFPYVRSKPNEKGARMIEQGFSISTTSQGKKISKTLDREAFEDITFLGQYPIGEVTYRHDELPVTLTLQAFSPFVPLELENSMFPGTMIKFQIRNTSEAVVETDLEGWLENAVLIEGRKDKNIHGTLVNRMDTIPENGLRIAFGIEEGNEAAQNRLDFGNMTLSVFGDSGNSFSDDEKVSKAELSENTVLLGKIGHTLQLDPDEEREVTFVLTWYFPKTYKAKSRWNEISKHLTVNDTTQYYSKRFKSALDVSDHIINKEEELTRKTRLWRDNWYDATLPYWFLDRTFLNTSILASSTSSIIGDGLFYGSEGGNQGPGTCTHVWGYVQAMGRLFPELEKSLRQQVDFVPVLKGGAMKDDGTVKFRWFTKNHDLAVDGQSGIVLRSLLSHQVSEDNTFLEHNYQGIKTTMNGLIDQRDADHDGILTGPQHNTLDSDWYGKVTWLSLHYAAALRAMAVMAAEMEDNDFAHFCLKLADKGRKYIEDELFNGEYFIQEPDPEFPNGPGIYNGLEYSQLFGQSWAYQVGLGEILDSEKVSTALQSMWKYNFSTDVGPFRENHTGGRWYAMPGEGGLIACTWPRGGSESMTVDKRNHADYSNESQNGYEYAATSLMMWHGMPYHALAHIWFMHNDRYSATKRNPWCEVEWGIHYSRSMASYGHFIAISGFEYHGPDGYMAFDPKITPSNFKSAFTAAAGWGSFEQSRDNKEQINTIFVANGNIHLKKLSLKIPADMLLKGVQVKVNGELIDAEYEQNDAFIEILFETKLNIRAKENLTVIMEG